MRPPNWLDLLDRLRREQNPERYPTADNRPTLQLPVPMPPPPQAEPTITDPDSGRGVIVIDL
jgi:hypothetical protein